MLLPVLLIQGLTMMLMVFELGYCHHEQLVTITIFVPLPSRTCSAGLNIHHLSFRSGKGTKSLSQTQRINKCPPEERGFIFWEYVHLLLLSSWILILFGNQSAFPRNEADAFLPPLCSHLHLQRLITPSTCGSLPAMEAHLTSIQDQWKNQMLSDT